jgi:Cu(I)/Ag(I) efflux system membrane fusion protein
MAAASSARTETDSALMEPVKSVFDHYVNIQKALASDSVSNISEDAAAIATGIRGDSMKMLPAKVADQADALAKAKDLTSARAAFKPLSQSLIQYLAANSITGTKYAEVYCPMAKASWLQTDPVVANPYLGKEMATCGGFVAKSKVDQSGHGTHDHSGHSGHSGH